MLMMTFHLCLKKISKPKHTSLKFDHKKLKDPNVLETFQAMIGGNYAPLTIMRNFAEKTKLMTNNTSGNNTEIKANGQKL